MVVDLTERLPENKLTRIAFDEIARETVFNTTRFIQPLHIFIIEAVIQAVEIVFNLPCISRAQNPNKLRTTLLP